MLIIKIIADVSFAMTILRIFIVSNGMKICRKKYICCFKGMNLMFAETFFQDHNFLEFNWTF